MSTIGSLGTKTTLEFGKLKLPDSEPVSFRINSKLYEQGCADLEINLQMRVVDLTLKISRNDGGFDYVVFNDVLIKKISGVVFNDVLIRKISGVALPTTVRPGGQDARVELFRVVKDP